LGVVAREVWAAAVRVAVLSVPAPPELPRRAGRPTVLAADPPSELGVDLPALRTIAADAAERALAALRGASDGTGLDLDVRTDLARRAAALLGERSEELAGVPEALPALARRVGMPLRQLLSCAVAYRDGGADGLAVLEAAWDPGAVAMSSGPGLLGPGSVVRRNRVTLGSRQLRLGRDGQWYPFRKGQGSEWIPDGRPDEVPVAGGAEVGELE
jgi:hypothetical protein